MNHDLPNVKELPDNTTRIFQESPFCIGQLIQALDCLHFGLNVSAKTLVSVLKLEPKIFQLYIYYVERQISITSCQIQKSAAKPVPTQQTRTQT